MTAVIQLEKLSKTYLNRWRKPVHALRSLDLTVMQGEAFGFVGANGAGKSTTIKLLTGAMKPSSGTGLLMGRPLDDHKSRASLGYVPENPSLYDYLTPLEVLGISARMRGVQGDVKAESMRWLERFGIVHVAKKLIRDFSKGMAQRTALAQAMVGNPGLLILDEPLSGLDPLGRREVVDILAEYRNNGGTIFFTSHVLHDVERIADRFGLIHQGEMRMVRSPADLAREDSRVQIRSMGSTAVAGMKRDVGERWAIELPHDQVWAQLERLRDAGHQIVEVRASLSLEHLFMQTVQSGSVGDTD
ncbi:ABC transporter ATP-binding protein [Chitinimonas prasina]|uniref:ABC transporter ATP-binding protein n=1 Tax=Chitinimonas prasina TaxID=1434937 RepID=A0ABQ5YB54_9NEIS|nr:ABC transporter ATP-binding protein [Chitinimonas prasina]GLR11786.1 ABC transporter ATP-binding protein [Chitinimonas prasina]